jgi:ribonucleotide reductase beta subunit family protein with ferritin-like domain
VLSKEDMSRFFEKQTFVENEIVSSINKALVKIKNPAVRGVLKGISLDSVKHAEMYKAAIELLSSVPPALTQAEYDELLKFVKKHIAEEERAILSMEEVMNQVEDEKVKLLLEAIFSDEQRHHKLLSEIMDILVKRETISEEDWWDVLWKNVPFHGAPGG